RDSGCRSACPVVRQRRRSPRCDGSWRASAGAVGASWNILGSHDSPRIRTTTGSAELHHVAAGLQFTLPGVPMVFAGDELGLEGVDGEDSRRTMPWASEAD
ncbi:MAG: alpha-amylase family glycosyl hydrolase, partial [Marmoricola sp.]